MEQYRELLSEAVRNELRAFAEGKPTELRLALLGFSKNGKQKISKVEDTWQYSWQNTPGGIEYILRYNAQFNPKLKYAVFNPITQLNLKRTTKGMSVKTMSWSYGDTENIADFVRELPEWPELGYKPRWGKWVKNEVTDNTWNAAVLAVLYELIYDTPVHLVNLIDALKGKPFTPTCQFNLSMGLPGPKHPLLTEESRKQMIDDLVDGKVASPLTIKKSGYQKPQDDLVISFDDD